MSDLLWGRTPVVRRKKLQSTSTTSQKLHIYICMHHICQKTLIPPQTALAKHHKTVLLPLRAVPPQIRLPTSAHPPNLRPDGLREVRPSLERAGWNRSAQQVSSPTGPVSMDSLSIDHLYCTLQRSWWINHGLLEQGFSTNRGLSTSMFCFSV